MRQQSHPNVLPLLCSFVHEQNLWMVMPYVAGGSVLNIMKYAYPEVRHISLTSWCCHKDSGLQAGASCRMQLPSGKEFAPLM